MKRSITRRLAALALACVLLLPVVVTGAAAWDSAGPGSLTITKTVSGQGADPDTEFDFIAVIGGQAQAFTLKHGQSRRFDNIPAGTQFVVTEEEAKGFTPLVTEYSGTMHGAAVVLPFANHYEAQNPPALPGYLEITKTIASDAIDRNMEFIFTVSFEGLGAPASPQAFHLKHGESKRFDNLMQNVRYTVTEQPADGYYADFTTARGVIAGEQAVLVHFTNRHKEAEAPPPRTGEVVVSGRKIWHHGANPERRRPASITVLVMADGAIVTQRLITAAEHWSWSFRLPKYNSEGREITYTIDEARFEGYRKTIDGFNLINTYWPGANTDDPNSGGDPPRTDDRSNPALWLGLLAFGLGGMAILMIIARRRRA